MSGKKQFGEVPARPSQEASTSDTSKPGVGWPISNDAIKEIEDIEANVRAAVQSSGAVVLGFRRY
jgi:hypothetical protein